MIGVIADDLTGAAELAAVGWRHGLRAEIIITGQPRREADLVCVDTDSRSCDAEEAHRRAASTASLLQESRAHWIYKKVDSVLRGQVVAEVEAVMKQLGQKRALLVPANPSLGRVVKRGRYYVHGKPIHKTEFARDPQHPRTASAVLKLLNAPTGFPIHVRAAGDPLPKTGIIVGDARDLADLQQWAALRITGMLRAGAAEFFAALLAATGHRTTISRDDLESPPSARGRELFVCGTSSISAREFVNTARERRVPVFSLPRKLASVPELDPKEAEAVCRKAVAAFGANERVILNIGLPLVRRLQVAARLTQHLIQLAKSVIRGADVTHVYAEGGATAAELTRRMGWSRLTVVRELAQGVATLAVDGRTSLLLTIKPGSYVWPEQIQNLTSPRY